MPTTFMGERETVAAVLRRVFFWIKALVDHDAPVVEENCSKDVGIEARARHAEQLARVVESDAELEVLLDDAFDGDRRRNDDATRVRVFGQQRRRVGLDCLLNKVGTKLGHLSAILICISKAVVVTFSLVLRLLRLAGQSGNIIGLEALGRPQQCR